MSDDKEKVNNIDWSHLPPDCLRFHLPYQKLCRQCVCKSERLKRENDSHRRSSELQFHKTLEAALKLYQDRSNFSTWENFKSVADMLAEIHRSTKVRLQKVFQTSYDDGAISYSRDFLYRFSQLSQDNNILCDGSPFHTSKLKPILCSPSDPPKGIFKRRRRTLTANRRRVLLSIYPQSSSSDEEKEDLSRISSVSLNQELFNNESSREPIVAKRARVSSPLSPCLSESSHRSHSSSICSICSDDCCSDESCSCEDKHSIRHSPSVASFYSSSSSSDPEND